MPISHISKLIRQNIRAVKELYPSVTSLQLGNLREITVELHLSVMKGELSILGGNWYVTNSGLLRIAKRRRCLGITTELEAAVSDPIEQRWVFRASVLKSASETFVGFGDANPSNISDTVQGAALRIAETRAVNRALRRAYSIALCSTEELGISSDPIEKLSPHNANGNGHHSGSKVRDRLCQVIRKHELDPELVKSYATDFCSVKTLREASREQVENFVQQLAEWAEKDRNALLCQLNSYLPPKQEERIA